VVLATPSTIYRVDVKAGEGNPEELFKFELPGWADMRRRPYRIKGQPQGGPYADPETGKGGGFRPARNELFKSTPHAASGRSSTSRPDQVNAVLA